jgi:hypothetical protein
MPQKKRPTNKPRATRSKKSKIIVGGRSNKPSLFSRKTAILTALTVGVIGAALILHPLAASSQYVVEAENLSLSGQTVLNDASTSASKAVQFSTNGSISGSISLTGNSPSFTLRAKGDQCKGAPQAKVSVDGSAVATLNVTGSSYTDYSYTLLTPIVAGSHNLNIAYENDYSYSQKGRKTSCNRNLYADKIMFSVEEPVVTDAGPTPSDPVATPVQGQPEVVCTKYAATTGNDTNPGTADTPVKSVPVLMSKLVAGDVGCLRSGVYEIGNYTWNKANTTLASYPGERATINGSVFFIPKGAVNVTLKNLNVILGAGAASTSLQLFGDNTTLVGNDITNKHAGESCIAIGEYEGTYAAVVKGFSIKGNKIHNCGKLANGNHDHGIYVAAAEGGSITDNLIYANEGGWGIQLWTHAMGTNISHNVVDDNYNGNIIVGGANTIVGGPSSNNMITQNIFSYAKNRYNVETYWSGGAVGTNNVFSNNCMYGAPLGNFYYNTQGVTNVSTVTANPVYADKTNRNYRLSPSSGCLSVVGYDTAAKLSF